MAGHKRGNKQGQKKPDTLAAPAPPHGGRWRRRRRLKHSTVAAAVHRHRAFVFPSADFEGVLVPSRVEGQVVGEVRVPVIGHTVSQLLMLLTRLGSVWLMDALLWHSARRQSRTGEVTTWNQTEADLKNKQTGKRVISWVRFLMFDFLPVTNILLFIRH